jgi:hypothetical protein
MSDTRSFHMTTARRLGDRLMRPLIRLGVVPGTYLLTVRGRKPGMPHSNPVTLVDGDEGRRSPPTVLSAGYATPARPGG